MPIQLRPLPSAAWQNAQLLRKSSSPLRSSADGAVSTREVSWRVMNVEPTGAEDAETFCAVVPRKHEFALAGGVMARNCGACEPECPVEAIFPEDALPEKWNAFVEINYAYDKGMDVINALTQKYADEHNVQNPPLE